MPHDRHRIAEQARSILADERMMERAYDCSNPFGNGHTEERVADLLANTAIDDRLLNKTLTF